MRLQFKQLKVGLEGEETFYITQVLMECIDYGSV